MDNASLPSNQRIEMSRAKRKGFWLMQGSPIRSASNTAFIALLALVLALGGVSALKISALVANNESVLHTYQVRESLEDLLAKIAGAKSEARGYVATRNQKYVSGYRGRSQAAREALSNVRNLIADNPVQMERLDRLEAAQVHLFSHLDQQLASSAQKPNLTQFFDVVQADMDQVQSVLQEMMNEEGRLLEERNQLVRASSRSTLLLIVSGAS